MKIAIFSTGSLDDMKGIMNYVQEKARLFKKNNSKAVSSDLFFLVTKYTGVLSLLKLNNRCNYKDGDIVRKDEVDYHIVVREYGLIDLLSSYMFGNFISARFAKKFANITSSYDAISAHQLPCIYTAMLTKQITGKPYIATWHGSDINVSPRLSKRLLYATKKVIEQADMNYFVSKELMRHSSYITTKGNKSHIYTGPSSIFQQYSSMERVSLRKQFGVDDAKVILFAGNLIPIKNVLMLPEVFEKLSLKVPKMKIVYWIVGNGDLEKQLINRLDATGVPYKMFGKVIPSNMPDIMNCADILILPSINEGFGLVLLEAIQCGCNVVGSRVGGIPESAGLKNTFELDNTFVDRITDRMAEILVNEEKPTPLNEEMSWEFAVQKEITTMSEILTR